MTGPKSLGRFPVDRDDIGDLDILAECDESGRGIGVFRVLCRINDVASILDAVLGFDRYYDRLV
jgi:hypothetical protein